MSHWFADNSLAIGGTLVLPRFHGYSVKSGLMDIITV